MAVMGAQFGGGIFLSRYFSFQGFCILPAVVGLSSSGVNRRILLAGGCSGGWVFSITRKITNKL